MSEKAPQLTSGETLIDLWKAAIHNAERHTKNGGIPVDAYLAAFENNNVDILQGDIRKLKRHCPSGLSHGHFDLAVINPKGNPLPALIKYPNPRDSSAPEFIENERMLARRLFGAGGKFEKYYRNLTALPSPYQHPEHGDALIMVHLTPFGYRSLGYLHQQPENFHDRSVVTNWVAMLEQAARLYHSCFSLRFPPHDIKTGSIFVNEELIFNGKVQDWGLQSGAHTPRMIDFGLFTEEFMDAERLHQQWGAGEEDYDGILADSPYFESVESGGGNMLVASHLLMQVPFSFKLGDDTIIEASIAEIMNKHIPDERDGLHYWKLFSELKRTIAKTPDIEVSPQDVRQRARLLLAFLHEIAPDDNRLKAAIMGDTQQLLDTLAFIQKQVEAANDDVIGSE